MRALQQDEEELGAKLAATLEKKGLQAVVARVVLVLDASGSMSEQYARGDVQWMVDRLMPLAVHFDDKVELATWVFADRVRMLAPVTQAKVKNYVEREWQGWKHWMWTLNAAFNNEHAVMAAVLEMYQKSALPTFVIFISDGDVADSSAIERILVEASHYPIFWQFVGLGGSNVGLMESFDTMRGRVADNCGFFALEDVRNTADEELYERLLNGFPKWLKRANAKGIFS